MTPDPLDEIVRAGVREMCMALRTSSRIGMSMTAVRERFEAAQAGVAAAEAAAGRSLPLANAELGRTHDDPWTGLSQQEQDA